MNKLVSAPSPATSPGWQHLMEAATRETNTEGLAQRFLNAQDALMDEIEDSFQAAGPSERQALVIAMNSLRELSRLMQIPKAEVRAKVGPLCDA
jgi:Spy/CpxP family protein refolding chaperone